MSEWHTHKPEGEEEYSHAHEGGHTPHNGVKGAPYGKPIKEEAPEEPKTRRGGRK